MLTLEHLLKFCAKADDLTPSTNDLKQPLRHEGYIYASDGRICIRVKDDGSIQAAAPSGRITGYDLTRLFRGDENVDLPIPTLPDRIECPSCHGTCLDHDCPTCNGEGKVDGDIAVMDCIQCDGTGKIQPGRDAGACWWCNGRGEQEHNPVLIGGTHFNRIFLALAAELPGAHFVRIDGYTVARIKFDGGEIAIMPTRGKKP